MKVEKLWRVKTVIYDDWVGNRQCVPRTNEEKNVYFTQDAAGQAEAQQCFQQAINDCYRDYAIGNATTKTNSFHASIPDQKQTIDIYLYLSDIPK